MPNPEILTCESYSQSIELNPAAELAPSWRAYLFSFSAVWTRSRLGFCFFRLIKDYVAIGRGVNGMDNVCFALNVTEDMVKTKIYEKNHYPIQSSIRLLCS
jgi:hypothetical protein